MSVLKLNVPLQNTTRREDSSFEALTSARLATVDFAGAQSWFSR